MARIVVTGAAGFVGRALARRAGPHVPLRLSGPDWRERIRGTDFAGSSVIHLAARVHAPAQGGEAPFLEDNAAKTHALALAAAEGGATSFVYASSIKVNGEETRARGFRADDPPRPEDAYARSKWEAERALQAMAGRFAMPIHVVRPPLVYGAGAPGNLAAFLRLCDSPWPLPFASLHNRRSWIAVEDLADLLLACARLPQPGIHTWLAAHPEPLSTARLAGELRRALRRPRRLVPAPASLLESLASMAGRRAQARRLTRSLEVDSTETATRLGWRANVELPVVVDAMVEAWRGQAR